MTLLVSSDLQAAIDQLPSGIIMFDGDYNLLMFNKTYCQFIGIPAEEMHGLRTMPNLIRRQFSSGYYTNHDTVEEALDFALGLYKSGAPWSYERHWPNLDIHILIQGNPLTNGGCVIALTDITERKQTEMQLLKAKEDTEELNKTLRARSAELTSEIVKHQLTEIALQKAKEEAEIANNAKSEFLAAMSHDLRTPLNAIMGFSDMMRIKAFGSLGDAHYEEYANDIYESGSLLISLINDVLDISKIEAGKYELAEETLDIPSLIQSSIRQLKNMAKISAHTLTTEVANDMPPLLGDERVLIQMLNNLISNAIKFTPDNGKIVVASKVDEDRGIIISVKDTGMGMSEDGILKALKPFEQADGTHSRRHEGTGLGLPLCVNFMRLFGGTIEIESDIGKGTTITLCFPPERTIRAS